MTPHELMIKTNHYLIKGGELTDAQKANIVGQLLAARTEEYKIKKFYIKMKADGSTYPGYFLPPYNDNKKYETVIPMSPKTHILSMNAYEMDIMRLLHLFAPKNPTVRDLVSGTIKRLKTTCFGGACMEGECFHTTLPVLRFLTAANRDDKAWMNRLVTKIHKGIDRQYKGNAIGYYCLCLSELPYDVAEQGLLKYKNYMLEKLAKSVPMTTERNKLYQPALYYVMRNCLSRFAEFEYIKNREPYVSDKDGRLYFNVDEVYCYLKRCH